MFWPIYQTAWKCLHVSISIDFIHPSATLTVAFIIHSSNNRPACNYENFNLFNHTNWIYSAIYPFSLWNNCNVCIYSIVACIAFSISIMIMCECVVSIEYLVVTIIFFGRSFVRSLVHSFFYYLILSMVGMCVCVIPIFIQLSDKRINDEMPAEYRFWHFFLASFSAVIFKINFSWAFFRCCCSVSVAGVCFFFLSFFSNQFSF